jgi:hypothetical protein
MNSYFWALSAEGTLFVVFHEGGLWYCAGVQEPINFDPRQIVAPCEPPNKRDLVLLQFGGPAADAEPASLTRH